MPAAEYNFDGLVGLTHSYAGLSYGNIASISHKLAVSNPKEAALQGLTKARALAKLGLGQGILPPQQRPDLEALRAIGFHGTPAQAIAAAQRLAPELLAACSSASSMWTANAATVSPSADTEDNKVHFTAANLNEKFHRSLEHPTTTRILRSIFQDEKHFAHHSALPASSTLGDEGAANHTRLCREYNEAGLEFFVYGRSALNTGGTPERNSVRFPARQTLEASQAIARLHRLRGTCPYFTQQNPDSIDAGAFHNDVISVGNKNVLFYHELAFARGEGVIEELRKKFEMVCQGPFVPVQVPTRSVSLADAVKSYLFNSQLVSLASGQMLLVAPAECQQVESVRRYLEELVGQARTPIRDIRFFDLRQSMQNGGGPACLRLRVVLTKEEQSAVNQGALLSDDNFTKLTEWVHKHYRDRMTALDLADPQLIDENLRALDELTQIMQLGSIYPFQF